MSLILKNGRILDPGRGVDRVGDLVILDGRIAGHDPAEGIPLDATVVDCTGLVVAPGFTDLYGRLPDLEKDAAAAAVTYRAMPKEPRFTSSASRLQASLASGHSCRSSWVTLSRRASQAASSGEHGRASPSTNSMPSPDPRS